LAWVQLCDVSGDRVIVTLSSGNLSLTQNALSMVDQRARGGDGSLHLWNATSMFDIARLVGDALREVKTRDGPYLQQNNIDSHANFIVGGQVRGESPRLFEVYSEGNYIEATPTPATSRSAKQVRQAGHRPRGQPLDGAAGSHPVHDRIVRFDHAL
jgi:predicted proteasome-type protease